MKAHLLHAFLCSDITLRRCRGKNNFWEDQGIRALKQHKNLGELARQGAGSWGQLWPLLGLKAKGKGAIIGTQKGQWYGEGSLSGVVTLRGGMQPTHNQGGSWENKQLDLALLHFPIFCTVPHWSTLTKAIPSKDPISIDRKDQPPNSQVTL